MALTTLLLMVVAARRWKWSRWLIALVCAPLLLVDVTFFAANTTKFLAGGWLPILFALLAIIVMTTWKRGRELVLDKLEHKSLALKGFVDNMLAHPPLQVPGTAVFLSKSVQVVPHAMLHNLKHNKILHERVIFLTVQIRTNPGSPSRSASSSPTLARVLAGGRPLWLQGGALHGGDLPGLRPGGSEGHHGQDLLLPLPREPGQHRSARHGTLAEGLFVWMNRNSLKATDFFHIPANRVVELGYCWVVMPSANRRARPVRTHRSIRCQPGTQQPGPASYFLGASLTTIKMRLIMVVVCDSHCQAC